jgi:L-seryl-tRNA(Ser) seleniumtransferase
MTTGFRELPSVNRILEAPEVQLLADTYSHQAVTDLVRQELERARQSVAGGARAPSPEALTEAVTRQAQELWQPGPRRVINATGVIIHTNLGRAPLSSAALQAVVEAARGYSDLEFTLADGERGSRQQYVQHLLCQLTGAEAALVVNNNASALLLALAAVAAGREVIVSRGEAVEIGGGFRIPEVLAQSGATLVEVGTTNRTYSRDYEAAITPQTGALLKVHSSNFRVVGFTHEATVPDLVVLAGKAGLPVIHDLGSGCLLETASFGLSHEPTPQESVAAGVDLALFSGDKLLGGPQAGIIIGKTRWVEKLARHPLARAIRSDKMSLAALSATLLHYVKDEATTAIPVWRMVAEPLEGVESRARSWAARIGRPATVAQGESTVGGGSLPGDTLPTWLLLLSAEQVAGGATALARRLRRQHPPVVARIIDQRVALDPRTVLPEEEEELIAAVKASLTS